MYCKALNCDLEIDGISSNWCLKHAKKMVGYYRTYKRLESELNIDTFNASKYSLEELTDINLKLLKIYHCRTTLQQQGYPDYQDSGHVKRINNILELIRQIYTDINKKTSIITTEINDTTESPRTPMATSSRKLRRKIDKLKLGDLIDDYRTPVIPIVDEFIKKYKRYLFDVVKKYFMEKFGDPDKGLKLFLVVLSYSFGIDVINVHHYDKYMQKLRHPGDFLRIASYDKAIQAYEYMIESSGHDHGVQFFYPIFTIIDSFRIPINKSIIYDSNQVYEIVVKHITNLHDKHKERYPDITKNYNDKLKILTKTTMELPKIDIGFCMRVAWSPLMSPLKIYCLRDTQYVYESEGIKSSILDMSDKMKYEDFFHVYIINEEFINEQIDKYKNYWTDDTRGLLALQLAFEDRYFTPILC